MAAPTLPDVKSYLLQIVSTLPTSYTDAVLQDALAAETAAQARVCRVGEPADLPDDLKQALMRRVARNLALRRLPLGIQLDDAGGIRLGSSDPEVRRLEAPHRKVLTG